MPNVLNTRLLDRYHPVKKCRKPLHHVFVANEVGHTWYLGLCAKMISFF